MVKDITGVILYNHPAYAYYASAFAGGHAAPDCSSIDGVTGVGMPGGDCRTCPYNKFGSGDGQSKLCKNKRMLYILREGELFPVALSLPTGSLKTFTNYVKRQLTKGRKISQIVTKRYLPLSVCCRRRRSRRYSVWQRAARRMPPTCLRQNSPMRMHRLWMPRPARLWKR